MANPPKYRFQLKVGAADWQSITPIWSAGRLTDELETGQHFHRNKFSGNLTLYRDDFDLVNDADFDTTFLLRLQKMVDGAWASQQPLMEFHKTDCRFKKSDKECRINSTESFDAYDALLQAMDKEHNMLDAEPPTTAVTMRKQAVLQVAWPGARLIMNYTDGMFWETEVPQPLLGTNVTDEESNHQDMLNLYGFGVNAPGGVFDYDTAIVVGSGATVGFAGKYDRFSYDPNGFGTGSYRREDVLFEFEQVAVAGGFRLRLHAVGSGVTLFESILFPNNDILTAPFHDGITLTSPTNPANTVEVFIFRPYMRLLTNKTSVGGNATTQLPTDDPFPHGAFTHALPIQRDNFIYPNTSTTTATRWGKVYDAAQHNAGQYFDRPNSPNGNIVMPVLSNVWTGASSWFYYDDPLKELQETAGETVTVQDCYKLSDAVKAMLDINGVNLAHTDSAATSDFYYSDGTNPIRGAKKIPVIVPISNILYDYDQPAQKALLRLSELLALPRLFHKVYFHISTEGRLMMEHYDYYDKGHSYATEQVGADLTGLFDLRTGKPILHGQDALSYTKQELPERIEPGWMFEVSAPFKGYPINVLSNFVKKGNVDAEKMTRFVSDLDYIHVFPQGVPTDGFVFLECLEDAQGNLSVPFVEFTVGPEEQYRMNNGYASFLWAHEHYHRHGLPAESVNLNANDITATSVIRRGIQEVVIPDTSDIDPVQLVTTNEGNARIETSERDLEGKGWKMRLRV